MSLNTSMKQQIHLSKTDDPVRLARHPFPLVQIAEKYKKELHDYNERTGNFPRVQSDHSTPETRGYQKRTWDQNVETVLAEDDTSKPTSSGEKKRNSEEPCDGESLHTSYLTNNIYHFGVGSW